MVLHQIWFVAPTAILCARMRPLCRAHVVSPRQRSPARTMSQEKRSYIRPDLVQCRRVAAGADSQNSHAQNGLHLFFSKDEGRRQYQLTD